MLACVLHFGLALTPQHCTWYDIHMFLSLCVLFSQEGCIVGLHALAGARDALWDCMACAWRQSCTATRVTVGARHEPQPGGVKAFVKSV
jgi:hypothetical protein